MNNHYNPAPFFPCVPNNFPNYLYYPQPPPNPIFRSPMYYPNYFPPYRFTRNHMMIPPPWHYPHISRRPCIKSAPPQSNNIILIEDETPAPVQVKQEAPPLPPVNTKPKDPPTVIKQAFSSLQVTNKDYEYLQKKVCEQCRQIENDDRLLLCDYCDDAYHTYCLKPILVEVPTEKEIWACPLCQKELETLEKQEKINREKEIEKIKASNNFYVFLDPNYQPSPFFGFPPPRFPFNSHGNIDSFAGRWPAMNADEVCAACRQGFVNSPKETCFSCEKKFHSNCFGEPNSKRIICSKCIDEITESIPNNINEYFDNFSGKSVNITATNSPKNKKKKKATSKTAANLFKLPVFPSESKVIEQKKNLFFYLKAKNMKFSDDLVYSNEKCSLEKNFSNLEPGLPELKKANISVIKEFKALTRKANFPPVLIEEDKIQGFIVRAYQDIAKRTLICEYTGEVDYARNKIFEKSNDSIMMLLRTTRSKTSLVICPKRYANIAKFISGINNFDADSKNRQNLESVRFSINNQARVFLYAKRNIKAGEILYYDYNAGGLNEYPTFEFV